MLQTALFNIQPAKWFVFGIPSCHRAGNRGHWSSTALQHSVPLSLRHEGICVVSFILFWERFVLLFCFVCLFFLMGFQTIDRRSSKDEERSRWRVHWSTQLYTQTVHTEYCAEPNTPRFTSHCPSACSASGISEHRGHLGLQWFLTV